MKRILIIAVIFMAIACGHHHKAYVNKGGPHSIMVLTSEFTPEVAGAASVAMTDEANRVRACLNRVYGEHVEYLGISHVTIVREPFETPEGKIKRGECRSVNPVTCIQVWDGDLRYWSAEVESVYRLRAFGYDKIYNREWPTPEKYKAGKQCLLGTGE